MSGKKCKHCGSSEIEVDAARGDAVCMSCGTVLEDNIIVAEVEFRENTHGGASAIGQFVSAESKGGATGFGRAFNAGIGQESKEITLRKARESITALCQQLRLNQQCIDIACNFYKMALSRHLTIGRPASHTQAACVYMTCRTEGTAHLLIDVSDAVPMYCYQLGRSYSKLSRALCINIPPTDPCLYVLRFASQLHFDDKQHQVASTALRLVQRMKRDSIHSGRRPSGICGAALLIAARLHEFSRTPSDIVRIVKIHESTLRKRLFEFGDTPSSNLTLDEFMTVDLEEEQDPPAFRAARKRDKERLQRLMEEEDGEKELTDLQKEIDAQLEKDTSKRKKLITSALMGTPGSVQMFSDVSSSEDMDATRFAAEDTLTLIGELANDVQIKDSKDSKSMDEELQNNEKLKLEKGLGPELAAIGLGQPEEKNVDKFVKPEPKHAFSKDLTSAEELVLSERDEDYVDSIIMNEDEANYKTHMWHKVNAGYLKEQKIKEEIRAKEKEENKDKKKKIRGNYKKKVNVSAATAGEAIEKMLASKKMSAKINYDILKTLDNSGGAVPSPKETTAVVESKPATPATPITPVTPATPMTPASPAVVSVPASPVPRKRRKKAPRTPAPRTPARPATPMTPPPAESLDDDYEVEPDPEPEPSGELSLAAMLQNGDDDDYYAYDYEEY